MKKTHHNLTIPLLHWYDSHGRKDLPWKIPHSAYRIWLSEIMLQQTQVKTVIPYFNRFLEQFPDIHALAKAPLDDVLSLWSGLGYYSRARNLHKTAQIISEQFDGKFPEDSETLITLPGIGASTAGAIAAQAFNKPTPILDGNVKRVLTRYFLIDGLFEQAQVKHKLWGLAKECMPEDRCADYTQAIMDLGALCCTNKNPACHSCPIQKNCLAYAKGEVANYPNKKARKKLPTKKQHFLLLENQEQLIYLERRPPVGIWGGLWCLPSVDEESALETYVNQHDLLITSTKKLLALKHTFSHFKLHMQIMLLKTTATKNAIGEHAGNWFNVNDALKLGLPKPIKTIIDQYMKIL